MSDPKAIEKSKKDLTAFFDWYNNEKPVWRAACDRIKVSVVGMRCLTQALEFCADWLNAQGKVPWEPGLDMQKFTMDNAGEDVKKLALALHDAFSSI